MTEIITNTYFINFVVPLITTLLVIFVKVASRNDQFKSFKKEDLAIGLETAVTALIVLISHTASLIKKIPTSAPSDKVTNIQGTIQPEILDRLLVVPWIVALFIVMIWGVSMLIRKKGWLNENEMDLVWGIIIPDLFGFTSLILIVIWISN